LLEYRCKQCESPFRRGFGGNKRVFCSRECADRSRRRRLTVDCARCGRNCQRRDDGLCGGCRRLDWISANAVTVIVECVTCRIPFRRRPSTDSAECWMCRKRGRKVTVDRTATCKTCGCTWLALNRGPLPARCADCKDRAARLKSRGHDADGRWRVRKHGITNEQFEEMVVAQGNHCGICAREMSRGPWRRDGACIDHDHATGAIRGLLCTRCNVGIGHFDDDPALLTKAIEYLAQAKAQVSSARSVARVAAR
jgi:hypothetical protein